VGEADVSLSGNMSLELFTALRRKESQRRERTRLEVLKLARKALTRMREIYPFQDAYIFGSIAVPYRFDPESSDVDIALEGLEGDHLFKVIAFLSGELKRDVDVVRLEDIGDNPFKKRILREGIRWRSP